MIGESLREEVGYDADIDLAVYLQMYSPISGLCYKFDRFIGIFRKKFARELSVPVGPNGFRKGHRPAQPPADSAPQATDTRLRLASVIAVTALPASAPADIMRAPEPFTALGSDLGAGPIRDALPAPLPGAGR